MIAYQRGKDIYLELLLNPRKFLTKIQKSKDNLGMVLPDEEKLEFVKTSALWIQNKDTIGSCFILNFGFDSPLPWPQVLSC